MTDAVSTEAGQSGGFETTRGGRHEEKDQKRQIARWNDREDPGFANFDLKEAKLKKNN
jgi:hypothetical protein